VRLVGRVLGVLAAVVACGLVLTVLLGLVAGFWIVLADVTVGDLLRGVID